MLNWSNGLQEPGAIAALPDAKADSRFHGRFKVNCRVILSWEGPDGNTHTLHTRGLDMSRLGARVESPKPMTEGLNIYLRAPELNLMGSAVVKHCIARGLKYRIGLEFRNPLTKGF